MYYRPFGVWGVVFVATHHFFHGRPRELTARDPGAKHRIHLRIKTSDISVYESVLLRQQYAFELPFVPKVIVDAGANIGMASIYYAKKYPKARVIALEPEASNFAVLARNVKHYPNIVPIHAALWSADGVAFVRGSETAYNPSDKVGFRVRESEGMPVRALTMRTLMSESKIECIDLLKIDVEGTEKRLFKQCNWMQRVRCLVIELHDRFEPGCSAAVSRATSDFVSTVRGETTFYIRKSEVELKRGSLCSAREVM